MISGALELYSDVLKAIMACVSGTVMNAELFGTQYYHGHSFVRDTAL